MFCMDIYNFNLVYRVIFYGWKYVYLDFCFYLIVYILYNIYMNNIYNYQFGIGIFFYLDQYIYWQVFGRCRDFY